MNANFLHRELPVSAAMPLIMSLCQCNRINKFICQTIGGEIMRNKIVSCVIAVFMLMGLLSMPITAAAEHRSLEQPALESGPEPEMFSASNHSQTSYLTREELKTYNTQKAGHSKIVYFGRNIFGRAFPASWWIVGAGKENNTLVLYAREQYDKKKFHAESSDNNFSLYKDSDIRKFLNQGNMYYNALTGAEKNMVKKSTIETPDLTGTGSYQTEDYFYLPLWFSDNKGKTGEVGHSLSIDSSYTTTVVPSWSRTPVKRYNHQATVRIFQPGDPGPYDTTQLETVNNTQTYPVPIFKLDISDVLFASRLYSDYYDNGQYFMEQDQYTLRLDGRQRPALQNMEATISADGSTVTVTGNSNGNSVYLCRQNETEGSGKKVKDGSVADATGFDHIWLEYYDENAGMFYAKPAVKSNAFQINITEPETASAKPSTLRISNGHQSVPKGSAVQDIIITAIEGYTIPRGYGEHLNTALGQTGLTATQLDNTVTITGTPSKDVQSVVDEAVKDRVVCLKGGTNISEISVDGAPVQFPYTQYCTPKYEKYNVTVEAEPLSEITIKVDTEKYGLPEVEAVRAVLEDAGLSLSDAKAEDPYTVYTISGTPVKDIEVLLAAAELVQVSFRGADGMGIVGESSTQTLPLGAPVTPIIFKASEGHSLPFYGAGQPGDYVTFYNEYLQGNWDPILQQAGLPAVGKSGLTASWSADGESVEVTGSPTKNLTLIGLGIEDSAVTVRASANTVVINGQQKVPLLAEIQPIMIQAKTGALPASYGMQVNALLKDTGLKAHQTGDTVTITGKPFVDINMNGTLTSILRGMDVSVNLEDAKEVVPPQTGGTYQFVEKDGLTAFDTDSTTQDKGDAKIVFGPMQKWWIAGQQKENELVLFAEQPLPKQDELIFHIADPDEKKYYHPGWECTYDTAPNEVYISHYGSSLMRMDLLGAQRLFFTSAEQELMRETTLRTSEVPVGKNGETNVYTTQDVLYLPYVAKGGTSILVGEISSTDMTGGLPVSSDYWNKEKDIWLRKYYSRTQVNSALHTGNIGVQSVDDRLAVQPAFSLNIQDVAFAVTVAAPTVDGSQPDQDAFTLRYHAGDKLGNAKLYVSLEKDKVSFSDVPEHTYLMVQNANGVWAKEVSGTQVLAASDINGSLTSLADCQVWLEQEKAEENKLYAVRAVPDARILQLTGNKTVTVENGVQTVADGENVTVITVQAKEGYTLTQEYPDTLREALNTSGVTGLTVSEVDPADDSITITGSPSKSLMIEVPVTKADARVLPDIAVSQRFNVTGQQSKNIGTAGMPDDAGQLTYQKGSESTTGSVSVSSWNVEQDGLVTFTLTNSKVGDTATLPITITSPNYMDSTVQVVITITDKNTVAVSANDIAVTYSGKEIPVSAITGTAAFGGQTVSGAWSWKDTSTITDVADSGTKTVVFTPADQDTYHVAEDTILVTIHKATPVGSPAFTKVTASGKTLKEALLTVGTITPAGVIQWDDADNTKVEANKSYSWTFTPTDTDNYEDLTGTFVVYPYSPSGGGGSYSPTYTITVNESKNGTAAVSPKRAEKGDTVTVTVKPDKDYELDVLLVVDQNGDRLRVKPESHDQYSFIMPAGKVAVEAVFQHIESSFRDVPANSYYREAVEWALENGVTSGMGGGLFGPDYACTRAQAVTFLWRAANSPKPLSSTMPFDDVVSDVYYHDAVLWAIEQDITAGTAAATFSPDATCTRAQIVTFLWRAAKMPAAESTANFADVAADAYYANAVSWAAQNGITAGTGKNTFSPDASCTRAQIVTFLYRTFAGR